MIFLSAGSSTLGEHFNPAKDCSDIVDNLPGAKDGFYWIIHIVGKLSKVRQLFVFYLFTNPTSGLPFFTSQNWLRYNPK